MRKIVKICMIGAGRVGKLHSQSINQSMGEAEVVAIVDPVESILHNTANDFGIDLRFATLKEAIDNCDFDAVVITTPTFTHKDLAVLAADHGKHVFLEKPMALSLEDCDIIMEAIKRNGIHLQLGFMRRFDPDFVLAAHKIESGEIGTPMMVKSLTHGPGLPPPWARDLSTSNGMLAEVNSHDWDTIRWLMGSNYQRVYTEVANFKGASRNVDTPNFYDNVLVNVKFESGGLGMISGICPCDYGYDARVEIVGEKGIIQIGTLQGKSVVVGVDRDKGLVAPIFRTWPERFAWAYIEEMKGFVHSILTGAPIRVSGEDGRWAVAGVLAGTRSFLENRPVLLSEIL